jgi:DNA mismatch endonuclease (patch repair protein)
MSRIRSKWTAQEVKIHSLLKAEKIRHKMHPKVQGKPDIILKDHKIAIFLHGCFWHMCSRCYKEPKTKKEYWLPKLKKNVQRDKNNIKLLKKQNYKVLIFWEHERNMPQRILKRIIECYPTSPRSLRG